MIGLFDSGVGGVALLDALVTAFPQQDFLYLADTAYFPYGSKSVEEIRERVALLTEWVEAQGVKTIIAACHTASAVCPELFGMLQPAVEEALQRGGERLLVLATPRTTQTGAYEALWHKRRPEGSCQVLSCENWAEAIERREAPSLAILPEQAPDVVLLGCTHYVALRREIGQRYPGCPVVDGFPVVTENLRSLVQSGSGQIAYFSTRYSKKITAITPTTRPLIARETPAGASTFSTAR